MSIPEQKEGGRRRRGDELETDEVLQRLEREIDSQVALSPQPWQVEPAGLSSLPELLDLSVVEGDVGSSVLDDVSLGFNEDPPSASTSGPIRK